MNDSNQKRMIADTGYEVKHAVQMGDREILLAENLNDPEGQFYLKAEYSDCGFLGQYDRLIYCSGYLAAMEEFIGSIDSQVVAVRAEIDKTDYQAKLFAADQCYPNDYGQSINEKVAVIKAEVLRPEYRRGDRQLVLVNGGFGSKANPRGNGVYCYRLYDGAYTRFERYDILGEIKELPTWAKERLAIIKAERDETGKLRTETSEPEKIAGYTVTERIQVGNKLFVLGENAEAQEYATWQHLEGRPGYDIGRYFSSREKALTNLHTRADKERGNILPDRARKGISREDAR
ncbi:MAG: hypothetical protein LBS84_04690 [Clostridiales bacterium]|jgi:hypothetical protein|nr:hypothetical protein [Clostridiales bacterium]